MTQDSNPHQFNNVTQEENILKYWKKNQIFQKSLSQTANGKPYVFYDGPPFATGLPHHGHLLASTIKDIIPRYQTMLGRYVVRRFGWDCHGLPIENEIHKKLGLSAQEALKKLGVKQYNQECRDIVMRFSTQWQEVIERVGRWVDFDHDYKTMDLDYMESVWWTFQQLHERSLVYRGNKVVPYSNELATPLANFEAGSNYQNVQDPAVTVRVRLNDTIEGHSADLLIWTTTPWTLPANLAICVNPTATYALVDYQNTTLVVAQDLINSVCPDASIICTMPGTALQHLTYQPIFPDAAKYTTGKAYVILCDDYVSTTDGTGLVHMAPAFGEDDMRICQREHISDLLFFIDEHGFFTDDLSDLKDLAIKKADRVIIKQLRESGMLFHETQITHSYPFCPRTNTPLIYRAVPSWFIAVTDIRDKCLECNKQIHWTPDHIQFGRFGNWLEQARDWAVSRNRVWGIPLPIWVNDTTGHVICMDSIAMLERYTGTQVKDLHREHVDHLTFTVEGEQGIYVRTPEVFDCWFESGAMPVAQLHYPFENTKVFEEGFPAEFIAEGLDQTRGWFYSLLVISAALFDAPAFKNVIVNGIILAKDGKKMSKSLKNYTDPMTLMNKYGADALRLYLINSGLVKAEEQRFDDKGVAEMTRKTLLPWHNCLQFLTTYARIDSWRFDDTHHIQGTKLDQWILSRVQTLKSGIEQAMNKYELYNVVPHLIHFIDELTNTYIRLNRKRFWVEDMTQDKQDAYHTLYQVMLEFAQIMAPFTPFQSESIYQELKTFSADMPESVHLCQYPQTIKSLQDSELEMGVSWMDRVLVLARAARNDAKIKIKTPLPALTIIHHDPAVCQALTSLKDIILRELNIKELHITHDEASYVHIYALPNSPVLGRRLGSQFAAMRQAITALTPEQINQIDETGQCTLLDEVITLQDILIRKETKRPGVSTDGHIAILLDTNLTQDLIDEGYAREVVNRIQKTRKDMQLDVNDRIILTIQTEPALASIIQTHSEYIKNETLTQTLDYSHEKQMHSHECEPFIMSLSIAVTTTADEKK